MNEVGILALQGAVSPHVEIYSSIGVTAFEVRNSNDLKKVKRLIIPGGESTTMLRLLKQSTLWSALLEFGKNNPVWGICAGSILIAKEVTHPEQASLGFIDVKAERNFYGSQRESFSDEVNFLSLETTKKVDFIRAPKLSALSEKVEVLGMHKETPVFFQQGKTLACSFHIELTGEPLLHKYFLSIS